MERVRVRPKNGQTAFAVIPRSQLEEMIAMTGDVHASRKEQQAEREALKKVSEQRVANWPNTIEASRIKKESERKARLQREEEQRRKADEAEAEYQAKQREEAIEAANRMLYEQNDRVKTFNSKMQLTAVLEERQKQLEMKKVQEAQQRQRDQEWHEELQQQLKDAAAEETKKVKARRSNAKATQQMQKDQLAQVQGRVDRARQQAKAEGNAIRAMAERAILQEIEEENVRKEKAKHLAKEYEQANLDLERHRAEVARQEELEEARIARFAQIKEEQMMERKRRQEEKCRRDAERRQAMISRQAEHLNSLKATAEARIQRDMDEYEVQQENKEMLDKERKIKLWKDIQDSRARQIMMKERKKVMEKREETEFQHQWAETAACLLEDEAHERGGIARRNKRLQDFQRMQAQEKIRRKAMDKDQERLEGEMMRAALAEEEAMFQDYVKSVFDNPNRLQNKGSRMARTA